MISVKNVQSGLRFEIDGKEIKEFKVVKEEGDTNEKKSNVIVDIIWVDKRESNKKNEIRPELEENLHSYRSKRSNK